MILPIKTRWVQIVDICLSTRAHNGGLISLEELLKLLKQRQKGAREAVFYDDCLRAISKLKGLGSGFEVISVGKKKLVRSVPTEFNKDHNEILELAQAQGFVTVDEVQRRLSWPLGHATDALETLFDEGLAMIDEMVIKMANVDTGFLASLLSLPMRELIRSKSFFFLLLSYIIQEKLACSEDFMMIGRTTLFPFCLPYSL